MAKGQKRSTREKKKPKQDKMKKAETLSASAQMASLFQKADAAKSGRASKK